MYKYISTDQIKEEILSDKTYTIHDKIDGIKELFMTNILERLRAEAMKHIRDTYPDEPERMKEIGKELRATGAVVKKDHHGDIIYGFIMADHKGKIWSRMKVTLVKDLWDE